MKKLLPLLAMLVCSTVWAVHLPEPTGFVIDEIGKLSPQNVSEMSVIATQLSKQNGAEVAVVLVDSISPETIESYSIKLAEKLKVGKKGQNNGVILVVAKQERKIRIEVGYGLEGVLPDSKAGQIVSNVISPKLKAGDWNGGVRGGFDAIVKSIGGVK